MLYMLGKGEKSSEPEKATEQQTEELVLVPVSSCSKCATTVRKSSDVRQEGVHLGSQTTVKSSRSTIVAAQPAAIRASRGGCAPGQRPNFARAGSGNGSGNASSCGIGGGAGGGGGGAGGAGAGSAQLILLHPDVCVASTRRPALLVFMKHVFGGMNVQ